MSSPVRKYHNRAFRYVLRPQDSTDMRFGLRGSDGTSTEQTTLLDLSETGASFLLGPETDLTVNERIKVEIPIPGGEQIAWWGRVVRLTRQSPRGWPFASDFDDDESRVRVAIKFDNLPEGHSRAIRRGIERAFMRAMRDQQYRNWLYYRALFMQYALKSALIFALAAFTAGFIYYFTLPSANYDAEKGAPWGERYKLFDTK